MDDGLALAAPPEAAEEKRYPVEFHGTAREYFGIWIVNILLTIITLGIYSAWAKVRRQRYFYGNTRIDGHSFEYHARPIMILIARVIVLGALLIYVILANIYPLAPVVLIPFFIFGLPYLICRGIRFNCRVTSYRNVRFDFVGGYGGAMKAFVLGTVITFLSLGFAVPVASRWSADYLFNNLRFGGRPFEAKLRLGKFYRAFIWPFVISIGGLVAAIGVFALLVFLNQESIGAAFNANNPGPQIALVIIIYASLLVAGAVGTVAYLFYEAAIHNLVFNNTVLDDRHALESSLRPGRFAWITISNTIVTLLTLGLMRPWAAIRMSRYMTSATALRSRWDFDHYHDQVLAPRGVAAAEYMDVEGLEVGLGF